MSGKESKRLRSSRRSFLGQMLAATSTVMAGPTIVKNLQDQDDAAIASGAALSAIAAPAEGEVAVSLKINGKPYPLNLEPRVTLLDTLRERVGLTGSKKGCDHGQCGACTVLIDGQRMYSCLSLAVMQDGKEITTIEGLAQGDTLHPVQAAFIENDGFQCGYCTPGQICASVALLNEVKQGTTSALTPDLNRPPQLAQLSEAEIRERLSGNLCRCSAYNGIVAAVQQAAGQTPPAPTALMLVQTEEQA